VLTHVVRQLESDGLIERQVYLGRAATAWVRLIERTSKTTRCDD